MIMRVVVNRVTEKVIIGYHPGDSIPGLNQYHVDKAVDNHLNWLRDGGDPNQSQTYRVERKNGTGAKIHIRGSDKVPHVQVCNGRY
jgi:hypothetical protein